MTTDKTISSKGKQDHATPDSFMKYINQMYPTVFDLAADDRNSKCPRWWNEQANSLDQDWARMYSLLEYNSKKHAQYYWLNPPFKRVAPWMEKCADASEAGTRIVTLTLASRGTNWYYEWVKPYALSLVLTKRLKLIGEKDYFTKELMLNIYGTGMIGEGYLDVPKEFTFDKRLGKCTT